LPFRKLYQKAVNAKVLAAPSGKVRVIEVALVKAVMCNVETIVSVAEKTSLARTG